MGCLKQIQVQHILLFFYNKFKDSVFDFNFDKVDSDGFIHIETRYFHDDYSYVETTTDKLAYLITQIALRCVIFDEFEYLLNLNLFQTPHHE